MLSKKNISEALGLSCVERYFLPWLNQYFNVKQLYGVEFLSIKDLFADFSNGALYETYYGVKRIQDVAESYGITKHTFLQVPFEELLSLFKVNKESLILIRVNNNFYKHFKRIAWRDDHFIMIDEKLNWLNEYPLSEGAFTFDELKLVYDGTVCIYQIYNCYINLEDKVTLKLINQDFQNIQIPLSISNFKGAIGVLRMLRKRLKEYFSNNRCVCEIINKEIDYLDHLYWKISFIELKNIKNIKFDELTNPIIQYEQKITEKLKYGQKGN